MTSQVTAAGAVADPPHGSLCWDSGRGEPETVTVSSYGGSREPGMVPAFAWLLAALAGIAYASWVLQFVVNPGLDPVNGYVSELSASDQPYHGVFAAGDFMSGVLVIAVVAVVLRSLRP